MTSSKQFGATSIPQVLAVLVAFTVGLVAGYILWGASNGAPIEVSAVSMSEVQSVDQAEPASVAVKVPEYQRLLDEAGDLASQNLYRAALDRVIDAELIADSDAALDQVAEQLQVLVSDYAALLQAQQRAGEIDALYQKLTLAMPEQGLFYLKLAEHRLDYGDAARALPVLAQIENHDEFGERARQLIAQITAPPQQALAELALSRVGDQFLIQARLDGKRWVNLLIDTGASLTVLSPDVLRSAGYRLDGDSASFATAGGVVQAPLVRVGQLSLGGIALDDLMVGALPLSSSNQTIDGLLGMNFLREFVFTLDQDLAVLRLDAKRL